MLCHVAEDDLIHIAVTWPGGGRPSWIRPTLTECGRHPAAEAPSPVSKGSGCHVCLPDFAHPLAEVWAFCRRFDLDANARASWNPPRFLEQAS